MVLFKQNRILSIKTLLNVVLFSTVITTAQAIELVGPKHQKKIVETATNVYGPIGNNDTLWRIALNARKDPRLSVDQVMIAIFMANPGAFTDNNINLLKNGAMLSIPSSQDIRSITDAQAKDKIALDQDKLPAAKEKLAQANAPLAQADNSPEPKETVLAVQPSADSAQAKIDEVDTQGNANTEASAAVPVNSQQLEVAMADIDLLIDENKALRAQLADMTSKLEAMQTQEAIDLQAHKELETLKLELAAIEADKASEHSSLLKNGWVIGTLSSLPAVLGLGGLFYFLARRFKSEPEPVPTQTLPPEPEQPDLSLDDDVLDEGLLDDELLISEDDDDELPALDELDELDDDLLAPDLDDELADPVETDDELLVPDYNMESVQLDIDSDEDSLANDSIMSADDIDALLEQADLEQAQGQEIDEGPVSADDIDALLEGNAPQDSAAPAADEVVAADDIDALLDSTDVDDIDALLEDNAPLANDSQEADEIVAADDIDALLDSTDVDDIDALLEGNAPQADEDGLDANDIDALLDSTDVDDIDALLEDNAPQTDEDGLDADDIDALLDSTDVDDIDALLEDNAPQADEDGLDADDIDALLDSTDVDDIDALLEDNAPQADEDGLDADDIDALLDSTDVDDIDELLEENSKSDTDDALAPEDVDALLEDTELAAEFDNAAEAIALDDIDALLEETELVQEADFATDSIDADDIEALLEETELVQETDHAADTIDLEDIDALLAETELDATQSDVESILLQEPAAETPPLDADEIEALLADSDVSPQTDAAERAARDELYNKDKVDQPYLITTEYDSLGVEASEEAQHLVDALDAMTAPSADAPTNLDAQLNELDSFLTQDEPPLVEDSELSDSMAEFDESQIIDNEQNESSLELSPADGLLDASEAELTEQLEKFEQENSFIDIDKLLNDSAVSDESVEPYKDVDLDTGLAEFPEVLPTGEPVDVDDDPNNSAKKLDLARAYLEIEDEDSALEILEFVRDNGDAKQQKEANRLLSKLKG